MAEHLRYDIRQGLEKCVASKHHFQGQRERPGKFLSRCIHLVATGRELRKSSMCRMWGYGLILSQILENYGSYNPCSQGQKVATINSDGSSYQICTVNRGNNYIQNWSVRQNKRSSGTVTTANHYNAYAAHGLNHNPLSAAAYQIVSTEGYGGSGSADITVSGTS